MGANTERLLLGGLLVLAVLKSLLLIGVFYGLHLLHTDLEQLERAQVEHRVWAEHLASIVATHDHALRETLPRVEHTLSRVLQEEDSVRNP